jgi:hypothetical protein
MTRFDVVVAGGGSAGIAAAVSAARAGARTLLVERGGLLGGMGTAALVHTICGLFLLRDDERHVWANGGFARHFAERLLASGGAREPVRMGRVVVMPHDPAAFAALADEMVLEVPELEVWMHAEIVSVAPGLESLEIVCRGVRRTVAASAYVDATGDATLTMLAGGEFAMTEPGRLQRPAYIAGLRGFADSFFDDERRMRLAHAIVAAVSDGRLPREALGAGFRRGCAPDEAFLTIDLAGDREAEAWDPVSPRLLGEVEVKGRKTARAIARYLRLNEEGCGECRVTYWPARAGVRESRRACGVYELTGEDIIRGSAFDDAIAKIGWPIELRERATGPKWLFPEASAPAQIPLRSLRHRDLANLWIAGRCLSCTHEAQASIRVMGTCMATGEAAGLAATADRGRGGIDWTLLPADVRKRKEEMRDSQ